MNMILKAFLLALTLVAMTLSARANTLETVKSRGQLLCGVNTELVGFAFQQPNGEWSGFDVDFCRALTAAIFGSPDKVQFVPLTAKERLPALQNGVIDVLSRNTTWTFSRDNKEKLNFVGVSYYDGQGFMIAKKVGIESAKDLNGASICVQTSTTTELNLFDFFQANKIKFVPIQIAEVREAELLYLSGKCDVYTADASALAATRASFDNPEEHTILPEIISKEPLGPAVRHGDEQWTDLVRWTLNALIAAEEYGITSDNVQTLAKNTTSPDIARLLGTQDSLGTQLGLKTDWVVSVLNATGNYGEIFERNIGKNTPVGLSRGLNAQWRDGGLLYAAPFR